VGSGGAGPTHLSIDPSGKVVLVANYTGGTVSVFPIMGDGALGAASDTQSSGAMTHHAVVNPTGGFAFVSALGANLVVQYKIDVQTGKLTPNGAVSPPASAGPRHLALRPDEKFAYGINETASSITTYAFDKGTGMLTAGATVSTLPGNFAGQNTCAEIVVHPTGGTVYGSNRGHDSIVTFASDATTGAGGSFGAVLARRADARGSHGDRRKDTAQLRHGSCGKARLRGQSRERHGDHFHDGRERRAHREWSSSHSAEPDVRWCVARPMIADSAHG